VRTGSAATVAGGAAFFVPDLLPEAVPGWVVEVVGFELAVALLPSLRKPNARNTPTPASTTQPAITMAAITRPLPA
jgi:hypothetical protein